MSITTYSELQAAIGNWLDHSLFAPRTGEFIALFEAAANRRLRVRQQEATVMLTPSAGAPRRDLRRDREARQQIPRRRCDAGDGRNAVMERSVVGDHGPGSEAVVETELHQMDTLPDVDGIVRGGETQAGEAREGDRLRT